MAKWKNNEVGMSNQALANIYTSRGRLDEMGAFLCKDGVSANFIISGGSDDDERYQPLYQYLDAFVGTCPMIILHNSDIHMEAMVGQSWEYAKVGAERPLWMVDKRRTDFEPFLGMTPAQIFGALRQLAVKLQYTITPRFERVVRAHIRILELLDIPVSLTGFRYLCNFTDMGEFNDNVLSLPRSEQEARRIWADLGADSEDSNSQFDLFRTIISHLAEEAGHSGWEDNNSIASLNILAALQQNATLLLSVNDLYADLLMPYLVEELKTADRPFILLVDNLSLRDENMKEYLRHPGPNCTCGIIAENVVESIGGEEADFLRFTERMNCFLFFKHSTGKTAQTLSEIMGRFEYTRMDVAEGTNRGFFSFLPRDKHQDVHYTTENRYRIMPEEITGLRPGQAIVFETGSDQIIRYN